MRFERGRRVLDFALKTALVTATLFGPSPEDVPSVPQCGIENAPQGVQRIVIASGDSLSRTVVAAGGSRSDVAKIRAVVRPHANLNKLRIGDRIDLHVREDGVVDWFRFSAHPTTAICARLDLVDETLRVRREEIEPVVHLRLVETRIDGRLVDALHAKGEEGALAVLIDDLFPEGKIRKSSDANSFVRVLVERRTIDGELLDYGRILAAEYRADGKRIGAFHFAPTPGAGGYYDLEANPKRSTRMRSPIVGANVASEYGFRRHPIRRRRRMHRGVDYSAARGAAVSAAASGVVISARWEGPLGRMVAIRHADGLVTHYAHMSGFAKRTRPGQRVRQGEVIGFVGSSGLSTGAHLHFETLVNGKHMDPLRLSSAPAPELTPEERETFRLEVQRLLQLMDAHRAGSDEV